MTLVPNFRMAPVLVIVLGLMLGATVVSAGDDSGREILESAVDHYAKLDAYAARMEINLKLPEEFAAMAGGMEPSHYEAVATRDGRVAFRPQGGMISDPFVQSADQWYVEIGFLKAYVLQDAVPMDQLLDEGGDRGIPVPGCVEFVRLGRKQDEAGSFLATESITDAGSEEVGGVMCRHLELSGAGIEGDVWVTEGATPWVVRILMDPPTPPPGENDGMMMITPALEITYSDWVGDPDLEGAFVIEINEDFTKRDSMPSNEEIAGGGGHGPGGDHESIGEPAPALSLATLDGGRMNLAELKGQVVVLDFWAVWCKPCLMALPGVIEVTSELADKGVTFYAVNQLDKKDKIRSLLKEKGWDLPVALDTDGSAGQAFGVTGIPHTVIIDREGVIRHVHSGFFPGMEKQLKEEVEALLAE